MTDVDRVRVGPVGDLLGDLPQDVVVDVHVLELDYPAVQGTVLVLTVISLLVFVLIDIIQAAVDPRVRLEAR